MARIDPAHTKGSRMMSTYKTLKKPWYEYLWLSPFAYVSWEFLKQHT